MQFIPQQTALMLVDLQNDFLHPEGAYGKAGVCSPEIAALPERLLPLCQLLQEKGGFLISTHFTLVPGKRGEPLISNHLLQLRPFLKKGDFQPGGFGHQLVEILQPADFIVEKVAYSAFYMSRLEWILRKIEVKTLLFSGIVTNGGVASTVRDAHVRDFETIVIRDGCAAFSQETHDLHIEALSGISHISDCDSLCQYLSEFVNSITI